MYFETGINKPETIENAFNAIAAKASSLIKEERSLYIKRNKIRIEAQAIKIGQGRKNIDSSCSC